MTPFPGNPSSSPAPPLSPARKYGTRNCTIAGTIKIDLWLSSRVDLARLLSGRELRLKDRAGRPAQAVSRDPPVSGKTLGLGFDEGRRRGRERSSRGRRDSAAGLRPAGYSWAGLGFLSPRGFMLIVNIAADKSSSTYRPILRRESAPEKRSDGTGVIVNCQGDRDARAIILQLENESCVRRHLCGEPGRPEAVLVQCVGRFARKLLGRIRPSLFSERLRFVRLLAC